MTQAKVISMRYRLFIFHKSLSKRAQYFGISVPRKKMSQRIVYESRQGMSQGKKFGNIIKSRWIIAAAPPADTVVVRVRGDGQLGRWLSSADSPYSNTSRSYVSERRGRTGEGERGGAAAPLNAAA